MKKLEILWELPQRCEVSHCCWKNGTNRLAWYSIPRNFQFVNIAASVKHNKAKCSKTRYTCTHCPKPVFLPWSLFFGRAPSSLRWKNEKGDWNCKPGENFLILERKWGPSQISLEQKEDKGRRSRGPWGPSINSYVVELPETETHFAVTHTP